MSVIYGAGGHGRDIAAFTGWRLVDDNPKRAPRPHSPAPFVIGVNNSLARLDLAAKLLARGWDNPKVAVSQATVVGPNVEMMAGSVVFPMCQLGCDVHLGAHTHLGAGSFVTRAEVGAFTTIGPGSQICGDVTIGDRCQIGAGAIVKNLVTIGDDVVIGAGAVIVDDLVEPGTYVGVPARQL